MRLITPPGVFQPRSDSWLLADVLVEHLPPRASVLDLCTGSGVLAIAAARAGAGEVVAVDVSRLSAATAWINARLNGVGIAARVGDLWGAVAGRRFDLVVSNPPYLPSPSDDPPEAGPERAWEGGRDGRAVLDRICRVAVRHLEEGGTILTVHSSVNGVERTLRALRGSGLHADVVARRAGPLGPLLAGRAAWLRDRGVLTGDREETVVVRGVLPRGAPTAAAAVR
ncbi:MAG: putative methyltransferase [Solirubrobacterales bacterium]|nr:putative methyltransferase [Solirubrobacterales bacterium]